MALLRLRMEIIVKTHPFPNEHARHDVQYGRARDASGEVEREPVRDTPAAVVAVRYELLVSPEERVDGRDDVFRQFALGVRDRPGGGVEGLRAVAVAAHGHAEVVWIN